LKTKTEKAIIGLHVVSEPGDATRYDYFVFKDYDDFKFVSLKNTFKYPQVINKWSMPKEDEEEKIKEIADEYNCNPWTVKECLRTIREILEEENNEVH